MPKTRSRHKKRKHRNRRSKRRSMAVAKVYILYVGGTIGMLHNKDRGLIPVKGNLNKLVNNMDIDKRLESQPI